MALTEQRKQEIWEKAKLSPEGYWEIITEMHEKIGNLRKQLHHVSFRSQERLKLVKKQSQKINELHAKLSIYE